jgi:predicted  nucleic acid-binding Zn-ribbon protein
MSEVKRYDRVGDNDPCMYELYDGDYVLYTDYDTLEKQYEAANMEAKDYCDEMFELREKLKAAQKQLNKANELILFDINNASDGAAMNHAVKLDKYRKELSQNGSKMEGK